MHGKGHYQPLQLRPHAYAKVSGFPIGLASRKDINTWKCRVRGVLARMAASGVRPREREYGALIMAHGAAGDIAAARAVLPEMRAHGVEPNAFTYTKLIGWRAPVGVTA